MRLILFALLISLCILQVNSQTVSLSGPTTARPGSTVTVQVNNTGVNAAAFQWTISNPFTSTTDITIGQAAIDAKKDILACTIDSKTCIIVGMNLNVIGNGPIANYTIQIPSNTTPGNQTLSLSSVIAASPNGVSLPLTVGSPYNIAILFKQDINGDGKVDTEDVQIMLSQVIASQQSPGSCTADMNSDSKCDLIDVMIVLLKALGN